MEIKVKVGQVWKSKNSNDRFVITHYNDSYIYSIFNTGKTDMAKNDKLMDKVLDIHFEILTDKYVGDWRSAIASPEFKGE